MFKKYIKTIENSEYEIEVHKSGYANVRKDGKFFSHTTSIYSALQSIYQQLDNAVYLELDSFSEV